MVPKLLVGLETWGHKLAASLSELVLQNKVGASGAEFGAGKLIWAPVVPNWCRKTNWAPLVPNLVPKNIGAEFGAEFLPELVPNMVPNWCRIIFGAKVVPNKIGRGARCPNSKFCYGFTPLENWGAF